jgi:NAD(P)-dependent dehydrogenase (short-subunit alcohol dehydrogenase family)
MSAFITGGAGSLGGASAEAFAKRGVPVAVVDLQFDAASAVAARISENTRTKAVGVRCDLTIPDSINQAWAEAEAQLGAVESVVNNAGIFQHVPFTEISLEQWNLLLSVNLTSQFLVSQVAARSWQASGIGGAIVNVASLAAFSAGFAGAVDYGVSKAGVVGLTIQLAAALAPSGIRVNAIAPGSFDSPMNAERYAGGGKAAIAARIPLRRIGQPEELAAMIVALALDATYTNGAIVPCDGGSSITSS